MLKDEEPLIDLERVRNDPTLDDNMRMRLSGQLPVIHIVDHPFFVDIRNDLLRPKDDFSTMGISFTQIDPYYLDKEKVYRIPYDPRTHEFKELNYNNITAIPKGIVVVDIPTMDKLDPVAYGWMHGIPRKEILEQIPMEMSSTARVVPWEQTPIQEIIDRNIKKQTAHRSGDGHELKPAAKAKRKKGKKL